MKSKSQIFCLLLSAATASSALAGGHPGSEFVGNFELIGAVSEQGITCENQFPELSIVRNVNSECMGLTIQSRHSEDPQSDSTNPPVDESWGWGLDVSHLCKLEGGTYQIFVKNTSHGGRSHLRGKADYPAAGKLSYRSKSYRTRLGIPHDAVHSAYALQLSVDGKTLDLKVAREDVALECRFAKQ